MICKMPVEEITKVIIRKINSMILVIIRTPMIKKNGFTTANGYSPLLIGIDCLKIAFIDDLEWEKVDNIFLSNLIKLNKFKKGELG